MARRSIGATVFIALTYLAWMVFSRGYGFLRFATFATFPIAAGLVATIWIQPKEVLDVSDKVTLTLPVLFVAGGVLLGYLWVTELASNILSF